MWARKAERGREVGRRATRSTAGLAVVLALGLCAAAPAGAQLPLLGPAIPVSTVGAAATKVAATSDPRAASGPGGTSLVVWAGEGSVTGKNEIFGQVLDDDGTPINDDFQISTVGGDATRDAARPSVAFNRVTGTYLVVWHDDRGADEDTEIVRQLVNANGTLAAGNVQLTDTAGPAGAGVRSAQNADVAYNDTNGFLLVWEADALIADDQFDVFGMTLNDVGASTAAPARLSVTSTAIDTQRDGIDPAVAYGSGEYLVVWSSDGVLPDTEEIFGQLVDPTGAEIGSDFRISRTGEDVATDPRDAGGPSVAYNPTDNEFLVAWHADPLATIDELEIFGQRVSATGAEVGTDDFRISTAGPADDADRDAFDPIVAYGGQRNEYLVAWHDDRVADQKSEIFGRRVSAAGAGVLADFRISRTGLDTDLRSSARAGVSYNAQDDEFVTAWQADRPTAGEREILAQRLDGPGQTAVSIDPVPESGSQTTISQGSADADPGALVPPAVVPDPIAQIAPQSSVPAPRIDDDPVRATADGRVPIELSCPAGGPTCRGEVVLQTVQAFSARLLATASQRGRPRTRRVVLGRTSYTIPAGRRMTASVRLSRSNRTLLRRLGSVRTRVTARPRGGGRATTRTITVRAPRRARGRR